MRLVDVDEIFNELKARNILFNADVNEVLTTAPTIKPEIQVEKVKAELNQILDSYNTVPMSKIDKIIGYVQSLEHMGLGKHKSLVYIEKFIREECNI